MMVAVEAMLCCETEVRGSVEGAEAVGTIADVGSVQVGTEEEVAEVEGIPREIDSTGLSAAEV